MRNIAVMACVLMLIGCGLEGAGSAAIVAKQQAEQAKQGKENMDNIKKNLDAATADVEQNRKRAEEAANN